MKIAFLVGAFPKLSETFILNQITGLIDRGHQVDIFADSPSREPFVHDDIRKYDLMNHTFHFYHGACALTIPVNKTARVLKAVTVLIRNFRKKPSCILKSLNFFKYGKEAASLSLLYKAATFLNKESYDIVCCHFGSNGILGARLKDIGAVSGNVVTVFHGADMSRAIRNKGEKLYRGLFRKGDLFLPVSQRWKDELIRLGCEREKIVVHRMGIDTRKFAFSPRVKTGQGRLTILSVARLVEKKGIEYGIRTVAKLTTKYPELEYRIIGDGPLSSSLERLIDTLNVREQVKLLGWMPQEQIKEAMTAADILLAPSVTAQDGDQEGIPVSLMEALALGMPVLTTRHSGIPELVQDGKSGFLLEERDIDSLAERMSYLCDHPEIWHEMGEAGRSYVEENYDIHKLNDRLVSLFGALCHGTPVV